MKEARRPLPQTPSFLAFVNQVLNSTHFIHQLVICPEGREEKKKAYPHPGTLPALRLDCLPADSIGRTGQRIGTTKLKHLQRLTLHWAQRLPLASAQSTSIINIDPSRPSRPNARLAGLHYIHPPPPPRRHAAEKGSKQVDPPLASASHKISHPQSSSRFAAAAPSTFVYLTFR